MNIMIKIECETISDLHTHLKVLQNQIKKQVKINKQNPQKDDFAIGTFLFDSNCYGTHELNVVDVVK